MTAEKSWVPERADVLIVGGGMGGLAAATAAAEAGAQVVVVEKGSRPGGSAAISVGMFWAPPDFESLRARVPLGDPALGRAFVEAYPSAVEQIRGMGIRVGKQVQGVMTIGIGYSIDVLALLSHEVAAIEKAGGRVICETAGRRLLIAAAARGEFVSLDAPLPATPEPLTEPPFYALEVVPSITFTYGGLRSDLEGRVLDHDSVPVSGLWVGGVDAGGLSNWTYAGGLAAAYFTGRRAGASVARHGAS